MYRFSQTSQKKNQIYGLMSLKMSQRRQNNRRAEATEGIEEIGKLMTMVNLLKGKDSKEIMETIMVGIKKDITTKKGITIIEEETLTMKDITTITKVIEKNLIMKMVTIIITEIETIITMEMVNTTEGIKDKTKIIKETIKTETLGTEITIKGKEGTTVIITAIIIRTKIKITNLK